MYQQNETSNRNPSNQDVGHHVVLENILECDSQFEITKKKKKNEETWFFFFFLV